MYRNMGLVALLTPPILLTGTSRNYDRIDSDVTCPAPVEAFQFWVRVLRLVIYSRLHSPFYFTAKRLLPPMSTSRSPGKAALPPMGWLPCCIWEPSRITRWAITPARWNASSGCKKSFPITSATNSSTTGVLPTRVLQRPPGPAFPS